MGKELEDVELAGLKAKHDELVAKWRTDESPEVRANFISKMLFFWVSPLFSFSRTKNKKYDEELQQDELWELPDYDETETLANKFEKKWEVLRQQGKDSSSAFTSSMWSLIRGRMILAGLFKAANSAFQFTYPILLGEIIGFIESEDRQEEMGSYYGYVIAAAFGLAMIMKGIFENVYFFLVFRCGWQVRSASTTQVYRKSLRLSASARQSMTIGQIVNLMQLDSTKLEQFIGFGFHVLWDGIFQITGYMIILYIYIGWAAFVGLAVMIVAIPVQGFVFSKILKINREMVKVTDNRVKLTNETLQGMESIKMAAWELKFGELIGELRKKEVGYLRTTMYLTAFSSAYMMAMPAITAVVALSVYAVNVNGNVSAEVFFAALTAFGQLRFPLMFYPQALNHLVSAKVSRKRLTDFLALEEVENHPQDDVDEQQLEKNAVEIENGEFYWEKPASANEIGSFVVVSETKKSATVPAEQANGAASPAASDSAKLPVLKNINLKIKRGSLTAIIGPVGSGKTSLVSGILGEMFQSNGTTTLNGSVAYAAQSAWIMNTTVRENILFGSPMDHERYRKVLKVCQLIHDLDILQDGDQTVIGERGINLSGGQKQRISVARLAYSNKDIVILDDPLSALDPEVARKMFNQCIKGFLSDRTVILVTNQLNFLPKCDYVVALEGNGENMQPGRIQDQGTGSKFASLVSKYKQKIDQSSTEAKRRSVTAEEDGEHDHNDANKEGEEGGEDDDDDILSVLSHRSESNLMEGTAAITEKLGKELMQVEERQKGAVKLSEYYGYIVAGGGTCFFLFILFLFVVAQLGTIGQTLWVSIWTDDKDYQIFSFEVYLIGYAAGAVLIAVLTYIRTVGIFYLGLKASKNLHENLVSSVFHAPMSFFDQTPIGRIVSRFSKDLFQIDTQLPMFFSFFLFTTMFVVFSILTVGVVTPWFLVSVPFLLVLYMYILDYYRPLNRDAKRLESISRSPIYAHFSETLGGLITIRSYGYGDFFTESNAKKVDDNLKAWYVLKAIERWIAMRLEILGSFVAIAAAFLAVYSASEGVLSAGLAGLSLSFAMSVTSLLNQTVRTAAELENGMNSVERVLYYSKEIEQEKPYQTSVRPPTNWPTRGKIEFRDLCMRYRHDTPLVLKGIDVTIEGGERVGIVGRTGGGKSSLLLTLLRLVEPEEGGSIFIDDVDISKIGLHDLRSNISIVPQNPVIFSGTIRSNIDPFNLRADDEIWHALEQCAMRQTIQELGGLDAAVAEYGENLSQGQKQLFALSKAILAQPKILLLDEATSSVDYETDAAIQSAIRNNFPDCTQITIAHRINTIIDSDKILVMDNGNAAEFDSPKSLLKQPKSKFTSMVNELQSKKRKAK